MDDIQEQNTTNNDTATVMPVAQPEQPVPGLIILNSDIPEGAMWYVVHTYSGHEKKAAALLKQRIESVGKTDFFFKIFIPQQKKILVSEGKKREVDEKLFPGYIIIMMLLNDDTWYLVRSTAGVTGFVGAGTNPIPISDKEVSKLMTSVKEDDPKYEVKFLIGDSVKITQGPFADFLGKIDEVYEAQGKVRVLVSFFGRETPVELDFTQVKGL